MVWQRKAGAAAGAPATAAPNGAPPPPTANTTPVAAPAGLPPVTTPPPAQPTTPPPAATTTAPRRTRGSAAASATPPATTPPPAAQSQPAAVTTTAPAAVSTPQLPGILAALMPKNAGPNALNAILEGRQAAGVPNIFPTVYMQGGEAGGVLLYHEMNVEGSNADLPQGKDSTHCILLGIRLELLLWPKGFERGIKITPRSRAVVSFDDFEAANVVQNAAQRYTFRNRATQDMFDAVGHPSLSLEMLVFDPQAGLYAFQTPASYDSVFNTSKELAVAFPVVTPTPVIITPHTYMTQGSKTQAPWPEHYYKVTQAANAPEMAAVREGFNAFLQENGANPELGAAIAEWSKQTLTQEQYDACVQIASLR